MNSRLDTALERPARGAPVVDILAPEPVDSPSDTLASLIPALLPCSHILMQWLFSQEK